MYKRAFELDPFDTSIARSYASFLCKNKRFEEAEECFKTALKNKNINDHCNFFIFDIIV